MGREAGGPRAAAAQATWMCSSLRISAEFTNTLLRVVEAASPTYTTEPSPPDAAKKVARAPGALANESAAARINSDVRFPSRRAAVETRSKSSRPKATETTARPFLLAGIVMGFS